MNLPGEVAPYVESLVLEKAKPYCVRLAADNRLLESWGDASDHGLSAVSIGESFAAVAPFLDDEHSSEIIVIPFLSGAGQHCAHVHVIPKGSERYVLYIDATEEFTQRRRLQQVGNEMRLLNHRQTRTLQALIEARTELDARRRVAEETSRRQSHFIAMLSHEFRTPLTSVLGYVQLVSEQSLPKEMHGQIAAIRRASQHMLSLVENILDNAQLESGGARIEPRVTDLRGLVGDVTEVLAPLAADKDLGFAAYVDVDTPQLLTVDSLRLRQILLNLLGNAVKFTERGSIRLELGWQDGSLSLIVTDTGPGIDKQEQARIFAAFHRARAGSSLPGSGLGLSITLRLVDLMGGQIGVDSAPGKGATFTVRVPAQEVQDEALSADSPRDGAAGKIVVADDDADIVNLVRLRLERAGFQVLTASNGREVLDVVDVEDPDLVLMDVNMPVLDGRAAARQLRAAGFDKPVLGLTATRNLVGGEEAVGCDFDECLIKPDQVTAVVDTARRWLVQSRLEVLPAREARDEKL